MRYGFISRRNPETIEKHLEALKQYNLDHIIIDDFKQDIKELLSELKAGDSLYIHEPPRDFSKMMRIFAYTKRNGIEVYGNNNEKFYAEVYEEIRKMIK